MREAIAVGIDIGGSKIAAAPVSREGLVGDVRVVPTDPSAGSASVLQRAIELVQSLLAESGAQALAAVGIGTGGWIDRSTGRVAFATGLLPGWIGIDLQSEFQRATGLPSVAVNDVHAMGIAEARLGAGSGHPLCLSVAVGTGIGGAITVDGRLFEGAQGMAGALGHITFRAGGAQCSCGRRGCIEAYASGPAVAASFAACTGRSKSHVDLRDVVTAMASSNSQLRDCARQAAANAGNDLGQVLGGVANTIDPDVIVLGGGASLSLGEVFTEALRTAVAGCVLTQISPPVLTAELGPDGGVVGAGLVALDGLE